MHHELDDFIGPVAVERKAVPTRPLVQSLADPRISDPVPDDAAIKVEQLVVTDLGWKLYRMFGRSR